MIDTANHDARRILLMMLTFIRVTLSPSKGVCCQDFRKLPGPTGGGKPDFSHWLVTRPHNGPANRRGGLGKILALIFSGLLLAGVGPVMAEEPAPKPPEFVPIVVDQAQYSAAMTYLNGLTFKDAAPIVGWLNDQEARAKAAWVADHAAKDAAKP